MGSCWVANRQTRTKMYAGDELLPIILKLKSVSSLSIQTNTKHSVTTRAGSLQAMSELHVSACVILRLHFEATVRGRFVSCKNGEWQKINMHDTVSNENSLLNNPQALPFKTYHVRAAIRH